MSFDFDFVVDNFWEFESELDFLNCKEVSDSDGFSIADSSESDDVSVEIKMVNASE